MQTTTAAGTADSANQASVSAMRQLQVMDPKSDQRVDMFSERGFALAQRIAKAYSTSNSIPADFRMWQEKKERGGGVVLVENEAALGNCLVAIEVAQAVRMSIAAVMQNADVIEGKLRWSGKFVIAAINASGRFTPLRFDVQNLGKINAKYKEKQGWNRDLGRFDFKDVSVEVENLLCVAWALPAGMDFPKGVNTLGQAKAAGLPVIEGAPVSMRLAVEEGWYGKSGSKWQTEMKHLMLQYRAGTFFGNIHAPDIVMGMGRTAEEERDIVTLDVDAAGNVTAMTTEVLRREEAKDPTPADVVQQVNETGNTDNQGPGDQQGAEGQSPGAGTGDNGGAGDPPLTYAEVAEKITKAATPIELEAAHALVPRVEDAVQQAELNALVQRRNTELSADDKATVKPATSRRARSNTSSQPE